MTRRSAALGAGRLDASGDKIAALEIALGLDTDYLGVLELRVRV